MKEHNKFLLELKNQRRELSIEQIQYIDGLMLGDGSIHKQTSTAYYRQGFAFRYGEWASEIQADFHDFGIDSKLTLEDFKADRFHDKEYQQWLLRTRGKRSNFVFRIFKEKWYNGRTNKRGHIIKTVPFDIDLIPPQTLANWYIGDGSYNERTGTCTLCTEGFTLLEVIDLCDKLNKVLSIKTTVPTNHNIYMSRQDSCVFLDYIKDYKLDCFKYKWGEGIRKTKWQRNNWTRRMYALELNSRRKIKLKL